MCASKDLVHKEKDKFIIIISNERKNKKIKK